MDQTERLFRSHYARLYRLAYSYLRDAEESKDIVSGVFAKVCEGKVRLRQGSEEATLLICVRNACLNAISQKQLHEKLMRLYPLDDASATLLPEAEEQRLSQMHQFIDSGLTPQTSRILRLCFLDGKSYKEVAATCGVSVSAVNKHIVQALRALRERFGK